MIIKSITIHQFRAFEKESSFRLGARLTVICGRNRTQKTTLLGIIGQPFSLSKPPFDNVKTIDGYNFKSQLSEKFKFSKDHDIAGEHRWTLYLVRGYVDENSFSVESIYRSKKTKTLRFWKEKSREVGDGYIQAPVYFLSLSRLYPVGEAKSLKKVSNIQLTEDELKFYRENFVSIFSINTGNPLNTVSVAKPSSKLVFSGINNDDYDFFVNSAGEGNISKIILAVLSFRRLKENYKKYYKSGLLLIDEIDATLHSSAQEKLIKFLDKEAKDLNLQILFTSHSPLILQEINKLRLKDNTSKQNTNSSNYDKSNNYEIINLVEKFENHRVINISNIRSNADLSKAICELNLIRYIPVGLNAYCEDKEATVFLKTILRKCLKNKNIDDIIKFYDVNMGWTNLIHLYKNEVPTFTSSLIFLDRDVTLPEIVGENSAIKLKTNNINFNDTILVLPLTIERDIYELLSNVCNYEDFIKIYSRYKDISFDVIFRDYPVNNKSGYETDEYKKWYKYITDKGNNNLDINKKDLFVFWCMKNKDKICNFLSAFKESYNNLAKKLSIDNLPEEFSEFFFNSLKK